MNRRRRSKGPRPPQGRGLEDGRSASGRYSSEPPPIVLSHHEYTTTGRGPAKGPGRPGGRWASAGGTRGGGRAPWKGPSPQGGGAKPGDRRRGRRRSRGRGGAQGDGVAPGRSAVEGEVRPDAGLPSAYELFCAYHLGIQKDGSYKPQNLNEIARRFHTNPAQIKQLLVQYGIDSDTVINADFDMALAQLDIMVAPPGVDRRELAKNLFDDFVAAPKKARNWARELAEDAEINRRTFGK